MRTSFISEHTAKFVLVPQLKKALSTRYSCITPIYYWASREGGIMSRRCFKVKEMKILALYPRRPKIVYPACEEIEVKINASI